MKRPLLSAIVLLAAIVLAVVTALPATAGNHLQRPGRQDLPPPMPGVGGTAALTLKIPLPTSPPANASRQSPSKPPSPPRTALLLTTRQRSDAQHIALTDGYVKRLIRGRRSHVRNVTPWIRGRTMRGAIVTLAFARPERISGDWLAPGRKPYRAAYTRVRTLLILVDLARRRVMAIVPRS